MGGRFGVDKGPRSLVIAAAMVLLITGNSASSDIVLSDGQTVYVPVYSHIYYGDKPQTLNLTTTLSIRNTNLSRRITILSVNYYDSKGKLVREYLKNPTELDPLASTYFLVSESDVSGGDTPSFIVRWKSAERVNVPIIEGVMISTISTQGISFVLPGQVIAE